VSWTPIYQSDPDKLPDSDFSPGEIRFLVVGNKGRLLDARRTPVEVTAINPDEATFEVEIQAFEDRGARWWVPFEDVGRYQFALGAQTAPVSTVVSYEQAAQRFARPLVVEAGAHARKDSAERLEGERAQAARWLAVNSSEDLELSRHVISREKAPQLAGLLCTYLSERNLFDMDASFSAAFVSNPNAGELVKGHAIVLAELGLCRYEGRAVRSPALFTGGWSREHRAEHLLARMGFTQALWARIDVSEAPLYRAFASEHHAPERAPSSFISATLSLDVAIDHFRGGSGTRMAAIYRQAMPLTRVFMTFMETEALSRRFKEAEAILIGDPANPMF
jgi:hypothetical protein